MNLLSVIHYPVFGGPHNRNAQLAPLLEANDITTTVLLPEDFGNAEARLRATGVKIIKVPLHRLRITFNPLVHLKYLLNYWKDISQIRRIIREYDIDMVLINGFVNAQAAFAARKENVPLVWQILDTRTPDILRRINGFLMRRMADALMCTGGRVADEHPGARSFGDRLVTFFPPVNTKQFSPDIDRRRNARKNLSIPDDQVLIGCVGNINPQKGHEYFVRAAGKIAEIRTDVCFRIFGSFTSTHSEYWRELHDIARDVGLTGGNQFQIIDPKDEVAECLQGLDLFMMTSVPRSEGTPTAILEAMATGIPVVATDVGSIAEIVEEDVSGYVVPPGDVEAIVLAALRLVEDKPLLRKMGLNARRLAVEKYDASVCVDTHLRTFDIAQNHFRARCRASG